MQKKPLTELLHDLEQEMLRLYYKDSTMKYYRNQWKNLLSFAKEQDEVFYSERLGIDFVEQHFHILEKDFNRTLLQSDVQKLRVIRMIGDFQQHRTILRKYYSKEHKKDVTLPHFIAISTGFESYCIAKGYSKVTIDHYVKQSAQFIYYLES